MGKGVEPGTQLDGVTKHRQLGKEGRALKREGLTLKKMGIAKAGSIQITNHKAVRCIDQSQGYYQGRIL